MNKMTAKPMPAEKELLNRKIYKEVKKMDRQRMEAFLQSIYQAGAEDQLDHMKNIGAVPHTENSPKSNNNAQETNENGKESTIKAIKKIKSTLHQHLGIGEKRYEKVAAEIENTLEELMMC